MYLLQKIGLLALYRLFTLADKSPTQKMSPEKSSATFVGDILPNVG